ncbi:MAG: diacylglycerol kinase [Ilumatobacteraceae bacterium]|jgi:YegS/Rv2252/BmrU family lipid kinase
MSNIAVVANTEKFFKKDARRLRSSLAAAGFEDVYWVNVTKGSESKQAAAKAVKRGATTVVVCGGDGSVRAASEALVGTSVALGVVPAGTANLFASGLELPTDIDEIVDVIVHGDRRSIDTAVCNGQTFNVMAGVGFDVAMLSDAEDKKEKLGTLAYVGAAVRETRQRKMFEMKVTVDGEDFYDGEASCVLVGNTGSLKGGLKAFPDASATDGKLHVAVFTAVGIREWASLVVTAALRKHEWSGHAEIREGAEVTVKLDKKRRFELDGGVKGKEKKLDFEIRPRSLIVCAPAQ